MFTKKRKLFQILYKSLPKGILPKSVFTWSAIACSMIYQPYHTNFDAKLFSEPPKSNIVHLSTLPPKSDS